jgi:hypothetical protein
MTTATKPESTAVVPAPVAPAPVVVSTLRPLRPVALPAQLLEQQNETRAFVTQVLEKDKDFGVIPGTDKPTMLKPGAEKVTLAFGLSVQSDIVEREIDHDRVTPWRKVKAIWEGPKGRRRKTGEEVTTGESLGLYRYVVRVQLIDEHGQVRGSGLGSCSTMESKYIDRPRDSENTALKMAFKRAHVAAVLTTLGLSEAFTQDVEDLPHLAERAEQPPEAFVMPFGDSKGKPIGELETKDLQGARKWASDKPKFKDFCDAADAVLKARAEAADAPDAGTVQAIEAAIAQLPIEQRERAAKKWLARREAGCTEGEAQEILSKLLAAQEKAAPAAVPASASKRVPSPHTAPPATARDGFADFPPAQEGDDELPF